MAEDGRMALLRPFGRILAGAVLVPFAFLASAGAFGVVRHPLTPDPSEAVVAAPVYLGPAALAWLATLDQTDHAPAD